MTTNDIDRAREWIDAAKLREVIEEARLLIRAGEPEIILNDLIALLATAEHAEKVAPMGRTTDEWAALLDGTTEGPWYVGGKGADGNTYVGNYDPDIGGPAASTGSDDAPLVAAAPDAVAEVIRLRRALEEQRDRFRSHAKADGYLAKFSTVPLVPFYGDQADLLDRILNGDTDD